MTEFNRLAFDLKRQQNEKVEILQERIKELEENIRIILEFQNRIDEL